MKEARDSFSADKMRCEFAARFMQATVNDFLTGSSTEGDDPEKAFRALAEASVIMADALMAALDRKPK